MIQRPSGVWVVEEPPRAEPPPVKKEREWVPVEVRWREKATGRGGVYRDHGAGSCWWDEDAPPYPGLDTYLWTEGNDSCDCNRVRLFLGEDAAEALADTINCGESRFEILSITPLERQELIAAK
jgi:hypothetical protein